MNNDFSTYLLASERIAQLHAEARAARLVALARPPRRHPLDRLRRQLAHALAPAGAVTAARGAHR